MIDPSAHLHYSEQHVSDRNEENLLSVYKLEKVQTYSAISHNQVLMSEGKKKITVLYVCSHTMLMFTNL